MAGFEEYFGDFPEIECEYCGESFPMVLLNEHEILVHGNEIEQFHAPNEPFHDEPEPDNNSSSTTVIDEPNVTAIVVEKAKVIDEPKRVFEYAQSKEPDFEQKELPLSKQRQPVINLGLEREQFKQYVEKLDFDNEKGEQLLAYGLDTNSNNKDNEKEIYKIPDSLFHVKEEKKEDIVDISALSDDECNESLEEFWKRAQDTIKHEKNKKKSEQMMSLNL